MQTVLTQLNSVPGVIGSMTCDRSGKVLAQAFPPLFDGALLQEAARAIADGAAGLDLAGEGADLLDFRFAEARLSVKPYADSMLLVLSGRATNLQFLTLSVALAAAKLARLGQVPAATVATAPPPVESAPPSPARADGDPPARRDRRIAAPSRGLEELRRRLGVSSARAQEKTEGDSGSFTLPVPPEEGPRTR